MTLQPRQGPLSPTVSRVLNNKGNVNPKIRDRVEAVP